MTTRTMNYTQQIPNELARTEAITAVTSVDRHVGLRNVAQSLSRRGVAAAKVELVNTALLSFVDVLYDVDPDGVTPNLDPDGRLLIPAPWGRSNLWQLRNTEQRALNHIMRARAEGSAPLFCYDVSSRLWFVGRGYTSRRPALAYLRQCPIALQEWRQAWAATRSRWAGEHLGEE